MKLRRMILIAVILLFAAAFAAGVGVLVYSRVGRAPFGKLTAEDIEKITVTYEDPSEATDPFTDYVFENPEWDFAALKGIRIFFPHKEQTVLFYGAPYMAYNIHLNDGTVHTVEIVGKENIDIDTGYYFRYGGEIVEIMKRGTPKCFLRIDGVLYDIRDEQVYADVTDWFRHYVKNAPRDK